LPTPETRRLARLTFLVLSVLGLTAAPRCARAAEPGDPPGAMRAARLLDAISVDGRLDEPAWAAAPPFSDFVQSFPVEGAPATERTEVRLLYDRRALYVGVRCFDGHPDQIVRPLGRRDSPPISDAVQVLVDANRDRRTAALFALTAGGVQADSLVYDDNRATADWDAVWEGAVALLPDGWSAEFAIPFAALRFPDVPAQVWGFGVQREVGRTREKSASVPLPRSGASLVSRLGPLGGIEGIRPRLDLELTPYLAGRLVARPQFSDPSKPRPRLLDPVADAGADFRLRLGSALRLTGALNPDFGQVEADEIVANFTSFETFFPEKRPFFTQGLDLFQPVGAGADVRPPHQLFYSRRIGLDAPILGAAKLIGEAAPGLQVGLLDAVVTGTGQRSGATEEAPDRRLRWTPAQPLTLAPGDHYPSSPPQGQNHLAGTLRWLAADRLVLGAQATWATPLGSPCGAAGAPGCAGRSGAAAALDFTATSRDGDWFALGQISGSRVEGPLFRVDRDGTPFRAGDLGSGAYLRLGKRGGDPWRFDVHWQYADPKLDLGPSGFLRTQNEHGGRVQVRYGRTGSAGPFHEWHVLAGAGGYLTTDGRLLQRSNGLYAGVEALVRDWYLWFNCTAELLFRSFDVREVGDSGVPLVRPGSADLVCKISTNSAKAVALDAGVFAAKSASWAPLEAPWTSGGYATGFFRPHPRVETRLGVSAEWNAWPARYVDSPAPGTWRFARLEAPFLSLELRQLLVLTRHLTFQLQGQLFGADQRFGRGGAGFFSARRDPGDRRAIFPAELDPSTAAPASTGSQTTQLVVNAVFRWEVRSGSTAYLVYARSQARALDEARHTFLPLPAGLGRAPATDSLFVKWSVYLGP